MSVHHQLLCRGKILPGKPVAPNSEAICHGHIRRPICHCICFLYQVAKHRRVYIIITSPGLPIRGTEKLPPELNVCPGHAPDMITCCHGRTVPVVGAHCGRCRYRWFHHSSSFNCHTPVSGSHASASAPYSISFCWRILSYSIGDLLGIFRSWDLCGAFGWMKWAPAGSVRWSRWICAPQPDYSSYLTVNVQHSN
jgi:hypothetical protein